MLLVLMMAHMAGHRYMRGRLQALLQRRLAFRAALDSMMAGCLPDPALKLLEKVEKVLMPVDPVSLQ